jgi:hypothetical protein
VDQRTKVVHVSDGYDVYIGRAMPGITASLFANPYRVGVDGTRDEVIDKYSVNIRQRLASEPVLQAALLQLKGKRIACWCRKENSKFFVRCHGDVLVDILEGPEPPPPQLALF